MSRKPPYDPEPLKISRNQDLIMELNDMLIRIKTHLYYSDKEKMCEHHPKPTNDELDLLQSKINKILEKDWKYLVKY